MSATAVPARTGADDFQTFYLGSHMPNWLTTSAVPLFISARRLHGRRTLPIARTGWALDSGGFTELQYHGRWTVTPADYVARVRRYRDEIGALTFAAPQDWMCEPIVIAGGRAGHLTFAGTGLSVDEHQRRTVANYLELRELAPELPFIPVLQGYTLPEYLRCIDLYAAAGVDLAAAPLVGLGSVCRRQSTREAEQIIRAVRAAGVTRLHGFGIKTLGLRKFGHLLTSADSMAWSFAARRTEPLPGCTGHRSCANCARYAYRWHRHVVTRCTTRQLELFDTTDAALSAA